MIERLVEKQIISHLDKNKIIILYGARQVGKTTLLKQIAAGLNDNFMWLNGDESDTRISLVNRSLAYLKSIIGKNKYVFIDEAQRIPDIGLILKLIHDNIQDVKLIVSGSSSLDLANKINEPLTGRKTVFQLFPFSFSELVNQNGLLDETRVLERRLIFGTYPDVLNNPGDEIENLKELSTSYLYKDLFEYEKIRKPVFLEKLLQALAFQVGSEVNVNEISRTIGLDYQTVEKYIDLLEKAFVIFRLSSFSRNLRNEIKKSKKIYFIDNGIRNAVIRSFNSIELREDIGKLWENYIVSEFRKMNELNRKWVNTWFWRTVEKQEIDYLEEYNEEINAYELKWNPSAKFKKPHEFLETYKNSHFHVINRENFYEQLV